MPVFYEFQTMLECDTCGEYVAETTYQHHMFEKYRQEGWKIGKHVTCPECVKRKQRRQEEPDGQ